MIKPAMTLSKVGFQPNCAHYELHDLYPALDSERKGHPCIEVIEACGEWFVHVVEEDLELTRSFELEPYALAFG
ncbi:hypothetical protein NKH57_29655 [Mesorhizobium sp. M1050]|uniref:hypothetical protein n=1 Tax=Mesorhizobium sp. M1050 TaxID=2957051 RepID=UPI003336117D